MRSQPDRIVRAACARARAAAVEAERSETAKYGIPADVIG